MTKHIRYRRPRNAPVVPAITVDDPEHDALWAEVSPEQERTNALIDAAYDTGVIFEQGGIPLAEDLDECDSASAERAMEAAEARNDAMNDR